jgi:ABC-type branched-subunit amino acid transport system substrate-binding protein
MIRGDRAEERKKGRGDQNMSKSFRVFGLAVAALALSHWPALAQATKVTNEGISANEIVIGTHQDLSGPIKVWGVPVSNGMKMAVEEINAAGGIQGRKLKLILEDNGYDPKKAVLASQKMVERDKVFAMIGPMGSPTVLAAQDILFDAGVLQLFPLTAAEFTFKFDPAKPQERLKFNNLLPYVESTRAALKYMMDWKGFKKPCIMHQDDEYGKNVLDGFNQELAALKVEPASVTSYKRGASDFSAQVAKMKSDGCDLVVLGTVVRETIGAMSEAKKLGWDVTFLGATPTDVLEVPTLGKDAVEGLYAAAQFEIPYDDSAKGKVKEWLVNYKKMFGTEANTQAIIGYNAVETFAFYVDKAGKDLSGQKVLDSLESGEKFNDIFNSPPTKFSKTDHLATTITQVQQVQKGRWVLIKDNLMF